MTPRRFALKLHPYSGNGVGFHWAGFATDERDAYATARRHAGYAYKAMLAVTGEPDGDPDPSKLCCATYGEERRESWQPNAEDRTLWRLGGSLVRGRKPGALRPGCVPKAKDHQEIARALSLVDAHLRPDPTLRGSHAFAARSGGGKGRMGYEFFGDANSRPWRGEGDPIKSHDPVTVPALLTLAVASELHQLHAVYNGHLWPPESATLAAAWAAGSRRDAKPALAMAADALEAIGTLDLAMEVRKRLNAL